MLVRSFRLAETLTGAAAFSSSLPPTQREIEGVGGEMWYEARHFGAGRAA